MADGYKISMNVIKAVISILLISIALVYISTIRIMINTRKQLSKDVSNNDIKKMYIFPVFLIIIAIALPTMQYIGTCMSKICSIAVTILAVALCAYMTRQSFVKNSVLYITIGFLLISAADDSFNVKNQCVNK